MSIIHIAHTVTDCDCLTSSSIINVNVYISTTKAGSTNLHTVLLLCDVHILYISSVTMHGPHYGLTQHMI